MAGFRRSIYSEHVPFAVLLHGRVLKMLASRSIRLILAIQPSFINDGVKIAAACLDYGIPFSLWPLLEDGDGRWLSDRNIAIFREHLLRLLEAFDHSQNLPKEVVFDLEPPIVAMRGALSLRLRAGKEAWIYRIAPELMVRQLTELLREVAMHGIGSKAVAPPMILTDPPGRPGGWQRLLGTPVDGPGFDRIGIMVYTSLLEGYSRGLLRRRDARALLHALSVAASKRWGSRASISLGVVGGGALGDEQPYRSISELQDDIAVVRAAGVEDLALFGLSGVLSRPPATDWLDTLVETSPLNRPMPMTLWSHALMLLGKASGRLLEPACRIGESMHNPRR